MIKKYGHLFPGRPAPNLTFTDTDGKALSLQSFKGQLLLVDIWGTWCAPCIEEMPYLAKLQNDTLQIAGDGSFEKEIKLLSPGIAYLGIEDRKAFCQDIIRYIDENLE